MRLKCIKLAGFKSFVDPTTVTFPDNLSCIVGPNGCGKSNVIDAVRWVMGESSAKHLRGESMTDVIFNGSNSRKPTTQASVELVFDNSDASLGGEYAKYNEIGLRRVVTREAQSSYYLNGTKCRRKDITDIFLGTGLGPRSYAIIEQGMISRLIEAKPEELRIYVEEAAGISKYKERRKETESRMKRTRENLERLEDLREELGRQLQHLERQAQAAERYKQYKQEERLLKAQLHALRWQAVNSQVKTRETSIRELEVRLEACIADQRAMDAAIERHRDEHTEHNDQVNRIQADYYSIGADIARLEQTIQFQRERGSQLKSDLDETQSALQHAQQQLDTDQQEVQHLAAQLEEQEPALELVQAANEESAEALAVAEEGMQAWQTQWDNFNQHAHQAQRQAEVEQSRIQHLEQSIERLRDRIDRLNREKESLTAGPLEEEVAMLQERMAEAELQSESLQSACQTCNERIHQQRDSNHQASAELDQARGELQSLKGRHASLDALQQAAMGDDSAVSWLAAQGLDQQPRLATRLQIHQGWETAVETALGDYLQAVCVDDLDAVAALIVDLEQGAVRFVADQNVPLTEHSLASPLATYVSGHEGAQALLNGIYAVDTLTEALAFRSRLSAGESVMTRDGLWLGPSWLRVARDHDAQFGVLQRQQQLEEVTARLAEVEERVETLGDSLQEGRERLRELEQERDQAQRELTDFNRANADLKAQLSARQVRLEQFSMRRERLVHELEECQAQRGEEHEVVAEARLQLQEALDKMGEDTDQRDTLLAQKEANRQALDQARQRSREDRDKAHQLALEVRAVRTRLESTRQGLTRLTAQVQTLQERRDQLREQLSQSDDPTERLHAELEERLEQRLLIEEQLRDARRTLETCEHAMRAAERKRSDAEQAAQSVRSELERHRMEWQGFQVQRSNLEAQLTEEEFALETVLAEMPEDASESAWQSDLERMAARIARLGAINLAAIEEFKAQSERKQYLDSQNADLIEALEILENAIRRIDRETRTRFKDTFDKVNNGLQELFPKVFGGGHAYLELTGDDLLDTGVAIMARPPGKKNSTIHLLSGGEKALTAIALVFSIFQLNPAPFCMLDEVDAPLDDANVGRYSRLVEDMSEKVQFIYITHNKIAMEMAHQLMGVTMHEPGVSRLVTVNVEEAAAMAAL